MVLSTLALVGIIQLILLLIGGIFFLFMHTRFLKKQIRELRGDEQPADDVTSAPVAAMTESTETEDATQTKADQEASRVPEAGTEEQPDEHLPEKVTGEISELRKMLDEKLLLTANIRKLIEALEQDPDSAESVAAQQKSSLQHLEEYINHSRKEGAAVEEKIMHYREQLAKAKKMLTRLKDQHEADMKQLQQQETDTGSVSGSDEENSPKG